MFKILLIEEETPLRELYRRHLESDGYEVVATASSREGMRLVEHTCPDLVVIDAHNPDMDGLEAVSRLIAHCPRIPVVLNSAPCSYQDRFICRAADAYIPKSRDTAALRSQIRKFVAPDAA